MSDEAFAPDPEQLADARAELVAQRNVTGLAKLRLRSGLSQQELAKAIGSSQPRLSMWEKGSEKPAFTNLQKLKSVLKVSYDELMEALDG